jgi:hypothetical protein
LRRIAGCAALRGASDGAEHKASPTRTIHAFSVRRSILHSRSPAARYRYRKNSSKRIKKIAVASKAYQAARYCILIVTAFDPGPHGRVQIAFPQIRAVLSRAQEILQAYACPIVTRAVSRPTESHRFFTSMSPLAAHNQQRDRLLRRPRNYSNGIPAPFCTRRRPPSSFPLRAVCAGQMRQRPPKMRR